MSQWPLVCLVLVFSVLALGHSGIEEEAIREAIKVVDSYNQRKAAMMDTRTAAGTIIGGRRLESPFTYVYLFNRPARTNEMHDDIQNLQRSAEIATKATYKILSRGGVADVNLFKKIMNPVCALPKVLCKPKFPYRTQDGSCNNLNAPLWGRKLTAQARFLPPQYGDKFNLGYTPRIFSKAGGELPNPRFISNKFYSCGKSCPLSPIFNIAFSVFAQFLTHDMMKSPTIMGNPDIECCKGNKPVDRPECFPFEVPKGEFMFTCMSLVRSSPAPYKNCAPGPREQVNEVSSYLDLSQIYGVNNLQHKELVDPTTGMLYTSKDGLLPIGRPEDCSGNRSECFRTGDTRVSGTPEMTVFHHLFHFEHNRLVQLLHKINPHWKPDLLYEEARKINTAVYQHIIYNEFLPLFLGKEAALQLGLLPTPKGYNTQYDPKASAAVRNEFSTAAFRYGHSQIIDFTGSAYIDRTLVLRVPLVNEFFKTRNIRNKKTFGPTGVCRWMTTELAGKLDRVVSDTARNRMFETKTMSGFDLSAIDIQRGRDHGLPGYNDVRRFCGLKPAYVIKSGPFGLPDHGPEEAILLSKIYKNPEDIDLITGGMSEIHLPGAAVGPTFSCIIGLQFKHSKIGDRFFYENMFPKIGFSPVQLNFIKHQSLSALMCRIFKMGTMQESAFISSLLGQLQVPCEKYPAFGFFELSAWKEFMQLKY